VTAGQPLSTSAPLNFEEPLSFRAAVGLQGHAGLEWDLLGCDDVDRALRVRGVVAHDRSQALWTVAAVAQPEESLADRLRLPGLDPDRRYTVVPGAEKSTALVSQATDLSAVEPSE
jgi:hypothetical protein